MGGVDLSDQLMNYYNFLCRSCKWWWKLWVHLFNMVILNGHVLNRAFGHQNNMSHYEYRYILVGALVEYTEVPQPLQPVGHPNDVRHAHWPERIPKSNKNNQTKTRKCKFCYVSRKRLPENNCNPMINQLPSFVVYAKLPCVFTLVFGSTMCKINYMHNT